MSDEQEFREAIEAAVSGSRNPIVQRYWRDLIEDVWAMSDYNIRYESLQFLDMLSRRPDSAKWPVRRRASAEKLIRAFIDSLFTQPDFITDEGKKWHAAVWDTKPHNLGRCDCPLGRDHAINEVLISAAGAIR